MESPWNRRGVAMEWQNSAPIGNAPSWMVSYQVRQQQGTHGRLLHL